jgi:hypothetical protein
MGTIEHQGKASSTGGSRRRCAQPAQTDHPETRKERPENPATTDNDMGHEAAAAADESENVYVLCACEDGDVILSFISEDKLMQLMAEPANDDQQNRVS